MKAKEIQELIDFISQSGLAEVKIETDEFKLSVKKSVEPSTAKVPEAYAAPAAPAAAVPAPAPAAPSQETPAASGTLVEIKSPMIGTFYRTPNPDSPSFVNVGDTIQAGHTVCIIEAMKLFNEIDSEVSGKIVKVLVENSSPVEFDQPLFLVDTAG